LAFAVMLLVAIQDGGVSAWLQATIYLLAAILFGLGLAGILRFAYFGTRASYRQGIYYIVFGGAFAAHGYYRIREHRADLGREEAELAPVVDAVRVYREDHGKLPEVLEELPSLPPHRPHLRYLRLDEQDFRLGFMHDVLVFHRYDSTTKRWDDELHAP
jgi:hypothetical protein